MLCVPLFQRLKLFCHLFEIVAINIQRYFAAPGTKGRFGITRLYVPFFADNIAVAAGQFIILFHYPAASYAFSH